MTKIKVYRFNPEKDAQGKLVEYDVPEGSCGSVLDALDYIRENIDSSLAYYFHQACGKGMCKTCILRIDGKPRVSCQTKLHENMTVEPLYKKVIVDLISER
ncbi:MAG: 2Fe-2S iron-sulfur cluster-binding protein [bacterium]